jgi:hypothetical protein
MAGAQCTLQRWRFFGLNRDDFGPVLIPRCDAADQSTTADGDE